MGSSWLIRLPLIGVSFSRMKRLMAAKVVVLPWPVAPAIYTMPSRGVAILTMSSLRPTS
ncbi:hypothetical protein D3C80_1902900 [compost metagenome]